MRRIEVSPAMEWQFGGGPPPLPTRRYACRKCLKAKKRCPHADPATDHQLTRERRAALEEVPKRRMHS